MRHHIESIMHVALRQLQESGEFPAIPAFIHIEATKNEQHGDFASNIAMVIAKLIKKSPCAVAEEIIQALPPSPFIQKIEIAEPGFINFFLSPRALDEVVVQILSLKECYGRCKMGRGKRILIEFLSANPTGPLHVGHGRHVAIGVVLANLLDAVGFKTYREYYVNDIGRQMDILTVSIWLKYLALYDQTVNLPDNAYHGDYILNMATQLQKQHGELFLIPAKQLLCDLSPDKAHGGDDETYIDTVIEGAKALLGNKYQIIFDLGLENMMADIREDLGQFDIHYDNWFSEREFAETDAVDKMLEKLKESGQVYEGEGALWFRSTAFGDEKDRVLVRSNGQRTYFANDIAYHLNKFERGFDILIDIFGADHHGYLARMKGAMQALGVNPERLILILVQFINLFRGDEQVPLSTREGKIVTLRELRHEVGNEAARLFYLTHRSEHHMDFDLELAKSESNENPIYYIEYAYARICSVFKQLEERHIAYHEAHGLAHLPLLVEREERQLLNTLLRYPDMIINAALYYEPHLLTHYLRNLAADFHAYYTSHQFLVEDSALRDARLSLIAAVRQTLLNGFNLLGIKVPESI